MMGGMMGSAMGAAGMGGSAAGGIFSALKGAGMAPAANAFFQSAGHAANPGFMGPFSPTHASQGLKGYKEGGLVQKYAEGGEVQKYADGGFLDYVPDRMKEPFFGLSLTEPYFGLGDPNREFSSLEKLPSKTLEPARKLTDKFVEQGMDNTAALEKAIDYVTMPESKFKEKMDEKEFDAALDAEERERLKPEDKTLDSLLTSLTGIQKKEGVKPLVPTTPASTSTAPQQQQQQQQQPMRQQTLAEKQTGLNLPLIAMGARMLASEGEGFAQALGMGVQQGIETKVALSGRDFDQKMKKSELSLKEMNAATNRMIAENNLKKAAIEESVAPMKALLTQLEVSEKMAEANLREAQNPLRVIATKNLGNSLDFVRTPEEREQKIQAEMRAIIASRNQTTPEGFTEAQIQHLMEKRGLSRDEIINTLLQSD